MPQFHEQITVGQEKNQEHLRIRLYMGYADANVVCKMKFPGCLDQNADIRKQFSEKIHKWLTQANEEGVYYAGDYIERHATAETSPSTIKFMANKKYFDLGERNFFMSSSNPFSPSERLDAFFQGPTIGECASVLQACMFRALEELVGTAAFNQFFDQPSTPFMITPNLFMKYHSPEELVKTAHKGTNPFLLMNPLYFLLEDKRFACLSSSMFLGDQNTSASLSEEHVELGDIIYFKGVGKYGKKHLEGGLILVGT